MTKILGINDIAHRLHMMYMHAFGICAPGLKRDIFCVYVYRGSRTPSFVNNHKEFFPFKENGRMLSGPRGERSLEEVSAHSNK
eukprot:1735446-Karenia_brevis.AAC.1